MKKRWKKDEDAVSAGRMFIDRFLKEQEDADLKRKARYIRSGLWFRTAL
ncbi:MAG: hypothetical protein J5722_05245 [Oscillospiraceae bacterium]|nr:hypothetical protein [Oscillospiraceae bacterium]